MKRKFFPRSKMACALWIFLNLMLFNKEHASGQATTGVFLGTVRDQTGAIVPGVLVVLTNVGTGFERQTQTDSVGDYRFSLVPLGIYHLRVEKTGLGKLVSAELELHVGEEKRTDFTVKPAEVGTTVEVQGHAELINTTSAERAGVIEGRRISELPLNFREFTQLGLLVPGAQQDFRQRIFALKTNISVNGLRSQNANLMIDGVDSNEYHWGGTSLSFLDPDAIAEFKLTTSNYSAELRGSSYNIRSVTKSGSNEIHGGAYEFLRNDALDARNFFELNKRNPVTREEIPDSALNPFRRNQFGAYAGGPIIKDKLFWFLDYGGLRERLTSPGLAPVPTADERRGIVKTVNPVTGLPDTLFVNLAPTTARVINNYPLPNLPGGPFGDRTFSGSVRTRTKLDQYTAKLDWQKSARDTFSARWTYFNQYGPGSDSLIQGAPFGFDLVVQTRNAMLSNTHFFTPNVVNQIRVGFSRDVGFPGSRNAGEKGLSASHMADGALASLNDGGATFGSTTNNIQFLDSVSYLRGRHSLKAGFEFRNSRDSTLVSLLLPGNFVFFPNATTVQDIPTASGVTIPQGTSVGTSLVTFLQGAPTQANVAAPSFGFPGPPAYHQVRQSAFEGFVQDDIRVTPRLTLNLGVRYEYHTVYRFRNRGNIRAVLSGPDTGDYIFNPSLFYDPDRNNFTPRIGFAYRSPTQTVIRGGFAIFTVLPIKQGTEGSYAYFPSQNRVQVFVPEPQRTSIYTPDSGFFIPAPAMFDTKGRLITPEGPSGEQDRVIDGRRFFAENRFLLATDTNSGRFPLNFRDPYVINWNLTLEKELPGEIAVSAAYVGNSGVALQAFSMPWCGINATAQECTTLAKIWTDKGTNVPAVMDNSAHSTFHSLQLEAKNTSSSRGYAFTVAYTLGKNLSDRDALFGNISGAGNFTGGGTNPLNRRLDKGPSIYDVRHVFASSLAYEPPFSRWFQAFPKKLNEGWRFLSIVTLRSGLPFNIVVPGSLQGFGFFQQTDRPTILVPSGSIPRGKDKTQYFSDEVVADAAALLSCGDQRAKFFCRAPFGQPGNLGRGVFRANGFKDIAFSVFKTTEITEKVGIQFRAEFFNIFNFVNLDQPDGNLYSPGFGGIRSTISTPSPPVTSRQIQFGLRLIF